MSNGKENSESERQMGLAPDVEGRRSFLRLGGAGAVATAIGGLGALETARAQAPGPAQAAASGSPPDVPVWSKTLGDPTGQPYGTPSKFEAGVARLFQPGQADLFSTESRTPLQDLDGIITPNGLHYNRNHAGVAQIDPAVHRLLIHGLVSRPMTFSLDDIRKFPSVSRIYFLECSGNPEYSPPWGKTAGDVMGLVSGAQWTGVPLRILLEHVGMKPGAKWLIAEGADGAGLKRSIPIEKCLDDAILAYSQNGERLRPEQGYPMRVFLPGYEGNMNIKWVRRLHLTDQPIYSRDETSTYSDLMPDGRARKFSYVMECKSVITWPSGGHKLTHKGKHELRGIAWTGRGKITAVDVSIDGGVNWRPAKLDQPVLSKALTSFRMPFEWNGEEMVIISRAMDETGYIQPSFQELTAVRGVHSTYHNNATQPWRIASNGEVSNARV